MSMGLQTISGDDKRSNTVGLLTKRRDTRHINATKLLVKLLLLQSGSARLVQELKVLEVSGVTFPDESTGCGDGVKKEPCAEAQLLPCC